MQKVDGVQDARVSLKDGLTVLELRPDNRVTLSQLRTVIKHIGFVSKDAVIVARGGLHDRTFQVAGTGEMLPVSTAPSALEGGRWRLVSPAPR